MTLTNKQPNKEDTNISLLYHKHIPNPFARSPNKQDTSLAFPISCQRLLYPLGGAAGWGISTFLGCTAAAAAAAAAALLYAARICRRLDSCCFNCWPCHSNRSCDCCDCCIRNRLWGPAACPLRCQPLPLLHQQVQRNVGTLQQDQLQAAAVATQTRQ
jgi:hypothetical protein